MKKFVLCFVTATILVACTTISFAPSKIGGAKVEVIAAPEQVQIYLAEKPKEPFEEIGAVHYQTFGKRDAIIQKMKIEASAQGGNALIDLCFNEVGAVGTVVRIKK